MGKRRRFFYVQSVEELRKRGMSYGEIARELSTTPRAVRLQHDKEKADLSEYRFCFGCYKYLKKIGGSEALRKSGRGFRWEWRCDKH